MRLTIAAGSVAGVLVMMGAIVWGVINGLPAPDVVFSGLAGLLGTLVGLVLRSNRGGE